jgi:hypothetical protein
VTDVTEDRAQDEPQLSAADEQVLRELTERARTGGLKLTGEGRLQTPDGCHSAQLRIARVKIDLRPDIADNGMSCRIQPPQGRRRGR